MCGDIIMEDAKQIAEALREIADLIENGHEIGDIPGEVQFNSWYCSDEKDFGEDAGFFDCV